MADDPDQEKRFERDRNDMVRMQIARRGVRDPRVLEAMRTVPRHRFVPPHLRGAAYRDSPLPIGQGQTISQPYIVAYMTELLELTGEERALEIGTGSGYQTAILSRLADQVYSVERLASLTVEARELFAALKYDNVHTLVGDGTLGWPDHAPYDVILVTAAAPHVPEPLKEQLADGGRLIAPIGPRWTQHLVRVRRVGNAFEAEDLIGVAFVPLLGSHGWQDRGSIHLNEGDGK
jgi:protein-L-isoaspartate(D-aspartate) O-methyltransferase